MTSRTSGFASAVVLRTSRPFTTSVTASSASLPDRVRGRSSTSSTTAGTAADITFTLDADGKGTAAVNAGCNTGSADVTVTDTAITFGPMALTKMMCDDAAMQLETAVTTTLTGETTYEIEASSLTIMSGTSGLTFTAGA